MDRIKSVQLKIDSILLDKDHKKYSLYFVLSTSINDGTSQVTVNTFFNDDNVKIQGKKIQFSDPGDPGSGLFIWESALGDSQTVEARLWVMHERAGLIEFGEILEGIGNFCVNDTSAFFDSFKIINSNNMILQGLTALENGMVTIGKALEKIGAKQIGVVVMDEDFALRPNVQPNEPLNKTAEMLSGEGSVNWSWILEPVEVNL